MINVKVDVSKAVKHLENVNKAVAGAQVSSLSKASAILHNEVKRSISGHGPEPMSVDTGNFLNSIHSKANNNRAIVYSGAPYSVFLEWGTSRMSPRRHFRNSLERKRIGIISLIGRNVKLVVEKA